MLISSEILEYNIRGSYMFRAEMNKELLCMNKMKLSADSVVETDTTYIFKNDLCKVDIFDEWGRRKRVTIEYIKNEIYFHHHNMMFVNLMMCFTEESDFVLLKDYTKPSKDFDNLFYCNSRVMCSNYPILGRNNYTLSHNDEFDYVFFNGKLINGLVFKDGSNEKRIVCMSSDCLHMYVVEKVRNSDLITFKEYYRGIYIRSKEYMINDLYGLSLCDNGLYQNEKFLSAFDNFIS